MLLPEVLRGFLRARGALRGVKVVLDTWVDKVLALANMKDNETKRTHNPSPTPLLVTYLVFQQGRYVGGRLLKPAVAIGLACPYPEAALRPRSTLDYLSLADPNFLTCHPG